MKSLYHVECSYYLKTTSLEEKKLNQNWQLWLEQVKQLVTSSQHNGQLANRKIIVTHTKTAEWTIKRKYTL